MSRMFLPGPVPVHHDVITAFRRRPESHRAASFGRELDQARRRLSALLHVPSIALLLGSGTLANDAIAAQLQLTGKPGLIVETGEFGRRLVDHARRIGLQHDVVSAQPGSAVPYTAIDSALAHGDFGWLWGVHCETSTGVLTDLGQYKQLAVDHDVQLCLDAVSSIGTLAVDLAGVWLASGVSGKGLGSYPGLAFVTSDRPFASSGDVPRYLDLGLYALAHFDGDVTAAERFRDQVELGDGVRAGLQRLGVRVLAPPDRSSPVVFTFSVPGIDSVALGEQLEADGFQIAYRSAYLVERNELQIVVMGEQRAEDVPALLAQLGALIGSASKRSEGR